MAGNIEYIEITNSSSVNKFNVFFLKKSENLFASLTIILYLWGVVRNVERYKILYDFLGLSYANKGWLVRVALFLFVGYLYTLICVHYFSCYKDNKKILNERILEGLF